MTTAPAPPGKPWEPAWGFWKDAPAAWQQTHWGFVDKTKKGDVEVLFLGDSITKGWAGAGKLVWESRYAPLKALNIGIGGDTTRQTLWRIEHQALEGIQPKVVVLMIGVNNIFTNTGSDEEIVQGIEAVMKQVNAKCPTSKILLLSVLPLGNQGQNARAKKINSSLADLAGGPVRYLDLSASFENPDGTLIEGKYTSDHVHLAGPGYAAWDEAIFPVLQEMLGKQ